MEKSRLDLRFVTGLIVLYQRLWSSWQPPRCRFYPSCSEYTKQALLRYGFWKGCLKGFLRLVKCHPWHAGGVDEV